MITVREHSGVEVVEELLGRKDAVAVLDPTFLLESSDWEQIADHNHKGRGRKYISLMDTVPSYTTNKQNPFP